MSKYKKSITVKEMVKDALKASGHDGLYNYYLSCGCEIDDLMPCDSYEIQDCVAAFKGPPIGPCECNHFSMYPNKETALRAGKKERIIDE